MLPRETTSPERARIRLDGQWSELVACIPVPATVYTARVNGAPAGTDRVVEVAFDGGAGDLADVLPGMTAWFGATAGGYERGQARVRQDPIAGTLYIGTESEIPIADNDFITIVDEFGLWEKQVRIDAGVIYMDYDVAYAGQHDARLPVVVMGGPVALELVGSLAVAVFDASGSWVPGGGAATFAWSAPGSASSTGMSTDIPTITYSSAGRFRVACTVTIGGVSNTRYEYVQIFDAANPPVTQFSVRGVTGSKAQGGYSFQMTLYAEATRALVRDRAQVILFTRDRAGLEGLSPAGYATGRENILATGWIMGESIVWSPELGSVTFDVEGAHAWLGRITAYPQGVQDTTTTPARWTEYNTLTMTAFLWHLLTWRSTVAQAVDCMVEISSTRIIEMGAAATSLWEQISITAGQRLLAAPCADHLSRLFVLIDSQYRASRSGVVEVMALTPADWRPPITLNRTNVPNVGMVDLSGFVWDGATATALFSLSPGRVWKRYGGVRSVQAMLLTDQDQANTLTGLVAGQANNEYPSVPVPLAGNNRFFDIAPDCYALLSLAEADTPRGVSFTDRRFIPRQITWNYDAGSGGLLPTINFEAETFAELAVTGDAPASEPVPPPDPPPTDTCPSGYHWDAGLGTCVADGEPGIGDGNTVYVVTKDYVARTRNFKDATPNWEDITGAAAGDHFIDFIFDPFDPVNAAWLLSATTVYYTENLNDSPPTWTIELDYTTVGPGLVNPIFQHLAAPITTPGRVYVGGYDITALDRVFVSTGSRGAHTTSWQHYVAATGLGGDTAAPGIRRIIAGFREQGRVFFMQGLSNRAAAIYRSTDFGATWGIIHNEGAFARAYDFDFNYSPDPAVAERYMYWMVADNPFGGGALGQILVSGNSGVVFTASASALGDSANPVGTPLINVRTGDWQDVMVVSPGQGVSGSEGYLSFRRTLDGGATWATVGNYGSGVNPAGPCHPIALGRWPYDPEQVYLLYQSDPAAANPDAILYSTDGAVTWDDKVGDWATVFGQTFRDGKMIVPLWLDY